MYNSLYLEHHGIKGQKWGIRRFQNPDGSYTSKGRKRYKVGERMSSNENDSSVTKKVKDDYNNLSDSEFMRKYKASKNTYRKRVNRYGDPYMNAPLAKLGKNLASKEYNYKTKKSYKNLTKGEKQKRNEQYTKNFIEKGKRSANRIEYLIDNGQSRESATKQVNKEKALRNMTIAGSLIAIYLGMKYIPQIKNKIAIGNYAAQMYGTAKGLNVVKGGPSLKGLANNIAQGEKFVRYLSR